jgi:hypothetical protein
VRAPAERCPALEGQRAGRISCGHPLDPRLCSGISAATSGPALIRGQRFHSDLFFREAAACFRRPISGRDYFIIPSRPGRRRRPLKRLFGLTTSNANIPLGWYTAILSFLEISRGPYLGAERYGVRRNDDEDTGHATAAEPRWGHRPGHGRGFWPSLPTQRDAEPGIPPDRGAATEYNVRARHLPLPPILGRTAPAD